MIDARDRVAVGGTRFWMAVVLALVIVAGAGHAFAQPPVQPIVQPSVQPTVQPAETDSEPAELQTFSVVVRPVAALGAAFGFPAYQTGTALASVQYRWAGLALRAGYGTAGVQASLDVRGYPPVPIPVPIYGAVGANVYGNRVAYHAALGAHVPLTLRWRLDIEAGVAWVPLGFDRVMAPHAIVGISYAIPFDPGVLFGEPVASERADPDALDTSATQACAAQLPPSPAGVDQAIARVVRTFLVDAQSVYGSVYSDLQYTYDVVATTFDGPRATATVAYSGSVREIATGSRIAASGEATVDLAWTGCGWTGVGFSY